MEIKYITLPFSRIKPYIQGLNPFDASQWPNEPDGWINIPIVVTDEMTKDDIIFEAITYRNKLIDKWLKEGNCVM